MKERHPKVLKVKPPREFYSLLEAFAFRGLSHERTGFQAQTDRCLQR
jgi:hypothetical protein